MLSQTAMVVGCLRSSKLLHSELLFAMLRSPLGFFDTTPSGRILNRFGKDIDIIDNVLPPSIRAWLFCLASVCGSFNLCVHLSRFTHLRGSVFSAHKTDHYTETDQIGPPIGTNMIN